nr:MAG TPA: hypothetical protein [Caudoviricetes sp.]
MKLNKEQVHTLNTLAKVDFDKAEYALEYVNKLFGTEYYWMNKRVVYSDDMSSIHAKLATSHDAWANAEE